MAPTTPLPERPHPRPRPRPRPIHRVAVDDVGPLTPFQERPHPHPRPRPRPIHRAAIDLMITPPPMRPCIDPLNDQTPTRLQSRP